MLDVIDWRSVKPGVVEVLEATRRIPWGKPSSYEGLGSGISAYQCGRAMGSNPVPLLLPCHRVSCGSLRPEAYVGGAARLKLLHDSRPPSNRRGRAIRDRQANSRRWRRAVRISREECLGILDHLEAIVEARELERSVHRARTSGGDEPTAPLVQTTGGADYESQSRRVDELECPEVQHDAGRLPLGARGSASARATDARSSSPASSTTDQPSAPQLRVRKRGGSSQLPLRVEVTADVLAGVLDRCGRCVAGQVAELAE